MRSQKASGTLLRIPVEFVVPAAAYDAVERMLFPEPQQMAPVSAVEHLQAADAASTTVFVVIEGKGRGTAAHAPQYHALTGVRLLRRILASKNLSGVQIVVEVVPASAATTATILAGMVNEILNFPSAFRITAEEAARAITVIHAAQQAGIVVPVGEKPISDIARSHNLSISSIKKIIKAVSSEQGQ